MCCSESRTIRRWSVQYSYHRKGIADKSKSKFLRRACLPPCFHALLSVEGTLAPSSCFLIKNYNSKQSSAPWGALLIYPFMRWVKVLVYSCLRSLIGDFIKQKHTHFMCKAHCSFVSLLCLAITTSRSIWTLCKNCFSLEVAATIHRVCCSNKGC